MNIIPSTNVLTAITDKIFIVSLPRTGTKSLSKMLMMLDYNVSHCPSIKLESQLTDNKFNVYADTPIYCPSIFELLTSQSSNKFIFIDRDPISWINSFERTELHLSYLNYINRDLQTIHRVSKLDRDCLIEIFGTHNMWSSQNALDCHATHKQLVKSIIPANQLLEYNFSQGWNTLCEFLNKPIPEDIIPHINKNTLFDKIK